jgi:iron complex outermembrane receptor protein
MKKAKMILSAGTLILFFQASFAQEAGFEEMFLKEELVEAATKKAEKIFEVPAFVSIVKKEDILKYGYLDLKGAISSQAGIETVESFFGYSEVIIRGVYPTHYNNKSLFLVDQYPIYEPVNGSFHLEFIPLGSIDKIEIIRGPGSSIYGTNAFSGIINVIPRNGKDINGFEIDFLAGVHDLENHLERVLVSYGKEIKNFDLLLSGEIYNDPGYNFKAVDETGKSKEVDYYNHYGNFIMRISGDNYKVTFGYFNQKKNKFGIVPIWATNGKSNYEGFYGEGVINGKIGEKISLTFRAGYNNIQRISHLDALSGYTYPSFPTTPTAPRIEMTSGGDVVRAELTGDFTITDSLSLLSGAVVERQHTDPYLFIDRDKLELHSKYAFLTSRYKENYGVYLEGSYKSKWLNLYAGGRYDYDTRRDTGRITPRAGFVVKPIKDLYVKGIYSEAFRYPNFFEYDVLTTNVLIGNKDLKEEFIRSIDLGIEGTLFEKISYSLVGFFEDVHDMITREPSPRVDQYPLEFWYVNKGGIEVWGGELSLSAIPVKRIEIFANGTLRDGETEEGGEIPYFSKQLFNIGLTAHLPLNIDVSPSWSFIGRREKVDTSQPDNTTRSYNIFNTTISYKWKDLTLRAIVMNLSGENVKYPDHIRGKVFIPAESNPSFYGEVSYRF